MSCVVKLLRKNIFIFVLAFVIKINQCDTQGTSCMTPLKISGECLNIKSCKSLIDLLKSKGATQEVSDLLRQSACGWEDKYPKVCCPHDLSRTVTSSLPKDSSSQITSSPTYSDVLPLVPNCGFSNVSNSRVVNGANATLGEIPWIVALGYKNAKNPSQPKWLCGGTLITERHVLTAGHCVKNRQDLYVVRLGELDLYSDNDGAFPTMVEISKSKIHEQYNPTSYTNDIAILTLAERNTNPTVWPICLPLEESLKSNHFEGYIGNVAGWGALYFNGPSSNLLQTATLPIVTNTECSNAFINFRKITIDQRVLCAGNTRGKQDACQGDSGGPLMYGKQEYKHQRYYLIGIVSFGFRCAEEGFPGVYSRITYFLDWIQNNLN